MHARTRSCVWNVFKLFCDSCSQLDRVASCATSHFDVDLFYSLRRVFHQFCGLLFRSSDSYDMTLYISRFHMHTSVVFFLASSVLNGPIEIQSLIDFSNELSN